MPDQGVGIANDWGDWNETFYDHGADQLYSCGRCHAAVAFSRMALHLEWHVYQQQRGLPTSWTT